jgi:PBP1b-binding outer membrane lipoprotein LpoB
MNKKCNFLVLTTLLIVLFFASCGSNTEQPKDVVVTKTVEVNKVQAPDFNADSAYAFVKA